MGVKAQQQLVACGKTACPGSCPLYVVRKAAAGGDPAKCRVCGGKFKGSGAVAVPPVQKAGAAVTNAANAQLKDEIAKLRAELKAKGQPVFPAQLVDDPIEAKQGTLNKLLQVQGEGVDVTPTIEKLRQEIKELKLAKMQGKKPHEQLKQLDMLIERKAKQCGKHDESIAELNGKIADIMAKRDELREGMAEHQEQRRLCLEQQSAAKGDGDAMEPGDANHCDAIGAAIKHAIQAVTANLAPGSQAGSQLARGLEQMDAAFAVLAANIVQADIEAKAAAAAVPPTPRVQPASPAGPLDEEPTLDEDMQEAMDAAGVKREAQEALFQKVVAKRAKRL